MADRLLRRIVTHARRLGRRRVTIGALVAAFALVLGLMVPWRGLFAWTTAPAPSGNRASLPSTFAAYSGLTATVWASPAGRAIALYESGSSELFTTWQTLVAGADRDTYRSVPFAGTVAPAVLLSPDGEHLLFFEARRGTDEFTLLDLATGRTRTLHSVTWHSNVGATVEMLAWSPDGRYVAYAVPAPPPADGTAASSYVDGKLIEELAILDVIDDSTVRLSTVSPLWSAAFAPDGRQLAVHIGHEIWVITLDGHRVRRLGFADNRLPAAKVSWSPDGSLLAIQSDSSIAFLDATGADRVTPAPLPGSDLLGWRDPKTLLVATTEDRVLAVDEVNIQAGTRRVLSRFDAGTCEYGFQTCNAYRVQLATGLLASATVRPSDPDRGPWPRHLRIGVAVVLVALLSWVAVRRRRQSGSLNSPPSLSRAINLKTLFNRS
jgi:WD40 repeat protein